MGKEIVNQVQEAQRVPGRINPRRNTPRHIIIKLTKIKDKDKMLKATREKGQIIYTGTLMPRAFPKRFLLNVENFFIGPHTESELNT